jgi:hypothetical protein
MAETNKQGMAAANPPVNPPQIPAMPTPLPSVLVYQQMPLRHTHHRTRPRLSPCVGVEPETLCAYCVTEIGEREHVMITECQHIIHALCALNNMVVNGLSPAMGSMFCPECYHSED